MAWNSGRRATLALVLLGLSMTLVACGDDDEDTDTSAGQTPATTAAAPTTTVAVATTAAAGLLKTSTKDPFGTFLTDATGKTLYIFDRDTTPTSACTGQCATTWPPVLAAAAGTSVPVPSGASGTVTVVPRPDGTGSQVVWNGKPLYRFSGDTAPGDTNGDGVGGTWHIAKAA